MSKVSYDELFGGEPPKQWGIFSCIVAVEMLVISGVFSLFFIKEWPIPPVEYTEFMKSLSGTPNNLAIAGLLLVFGAVILVASRELLARSLNDIKEGQSRLWISVQGVVKDIWLEERLGESGGDVYQSNMKVEYVVDSGTYSATIQLL